VAELVTIRPVDMIGQNSKEIENESDNRKSIRKVLFRDQVRFDRVIPKAEPKRATAINERWRDEHLGMGLKEE
jgi:hypothetical protein